LSAQERYSEAIELRRVELAWCRERDGDTDPGTLSSINGLAIDLRKIGALEEAEALSRELLAARRQVLEPSDLSIGLALSGLAKTLEEAGKLEEAAVYREQALYHRLEYEAPDASCTNRERLNLARVLQKLSRTEQAIQLLDQLDSSMKNIVEPSESDASLLEEAASLRSNIKPSKN
jgi:tetratricopeptide (TPR) repeat protein